MATVNSSLIHHATIRSFPPVARIDAKVLILGSMPGKVSLTRQQYYAHARNLFWPLMGELFGAGPDLPYELRLARLQECGVALWDVLHECERISSLDAHIIENSIVANNFAGFLARHTAIRRICFNGTKAEQAFRRYVLPEIPLTIELVGLPSTSPANASIPLEIKRQRWQEGLGG
jgi:double-stranded uracil-DNA glycosylase